MRVQVSRIAIFGHSYVGKTTTADELARKLDSPVRHCSEFLSVEADRRGFHQPYSREFHQWVDEASRKWVANNKEGFVIEGRFLHRVLTQSEGVFFVHLVCSIQERARRLLTTRATKIPLALLSASDHDDDTHEKLVYEAAPNHHVTDLTLDTSDLSLEAVVSAIISASSESG